MLPTETRRRGCFHFTWTWYLSIQTITALIRFDSACLDLIGESKAPPSGREDGLRSPTREQGLMTTRPLHCHVRNEISKLSLPPSDMYSSNPPIAKKSFEEIAKILSGSIGVG